MGEVVNLRRARRAKARADDEAQAAANRLAFGRTKAEKAMAAADRQRADRMLDSARAEPSRSDGATDGR